MREGLLGWSTDMLVRLDDECPGVLGRVLTASVGRRQAIFAALAVQSDMSTVYLAGDDLISTGLGEVIRHGRVRDILRHAFKAVPEGLPGLLARIGERPLPRSQDYLSLHRLAAGGSIRSLDALRGDGISGRKLDVLAALDPRWHHTNTLTRLDTPAEAMRFNAAVEFVQSVCSRADDGVVAAAIAAMAPSSTLPRLLDRFVRRADRLPQNPVKAGDDELRPFVSMGDYLDAARRYRNCLASKLDHVAAGRLAIAEFQGLVLLEFRPLRASDRGWMLWLVHGPRNSPVACKLIEAAEQKCDLLAIPRVNDAAGGSRWRSFRSFARQVDWD